MRNLRHAFFVVASTALVSFPSLSSAIVWRHDITDQMVRDHGNQARFNGVGQVRVGGGFGTGSFLGVGTGGNAWILSAKHVITTGETGTFWFENNTSFNIVQTIGIAGTDVSIARLASFNAAWNPVRLNPNAALTGGTLLDSAGYGGSGAQGSLGGNWNYDDRRRGMQTRLTGTENVNFNGDNFLAIVDTFDAPNTSNVRPIEGFGAPGDSGSALLTADNVALGVLAFGEFETYGARNWYAALTPSVVNQIVNLTGIAPVPEPGTMAALGLGALALMRRRKKA